MKAIKTWLNEFDSEIDSEGEDDDDSYAEDDEVSNEEPELDENDDVSDSELQLVVEALEDAVVGNLAGGGAGDFIVSDGIAFAPGHVMSPEEQMFMEVVFDIDADYEDDDGNDYDSMIAMGGLQAEDEHEEEEEELAELEQNGLIEDYGMYSGDDSEDEEDYGDEMY